MVSAISRAPASRCSSVASSGEKLPSSRRAVRRVGVALARRLEGVLLSSLNALPQFLGRFLQAHQLLVSSADRSGP